ncbi:MAG: metallophosphoesterase [Lachnospiraceae bacterium]|nr:metallophosphoesterase [Lachnospiraceae bacterium]
MNILLIGVIIAVLVFFLAVMIVDSNRFVTRRYEIKTDKIKTDKRYVFVSDLHGKAYGSKDNKRLLDAIGKLEPDAVLVGGDILTAYPGNDFYVASNFVKGLSEKYKLIYAEGNHEFRARIFPDVYKSMHTDYIREIGDAGVKICVNEAVEDGDVMVYCLSIDYPYYKRFKQFPMDDSYLNSVMGEADKDKFCVLLAHNPDYFEQYAKWGADLTLSGHVHGGVVRIPFWRGVVSPMCTFFPKYDGGMFEKYGNKMIVSRGLGMHTIPFRMFNPAEIVVIDLKCDVKA